MSFVLAGLACWVFGLAMLANAASQKSIDDRHLFLPLVMHGASPLPSAARWGTPIARDPQRGLIWVVNPDAGSVAAIDPDQLQLVQTLPVGVEPWSLAFTPDGTSLLVLDRARGELVVLDPVQATVRARLALGPEPAQVVVSPDGERAYVTLQAMHMLIIVDLHSFTFLRHVPLSAHPYGVAVSADGSRVYVTHFYAQSVMPAGMGRDDGAQGLVSVLDAYGDHVGTIYLSPDQHGFANQLASIAIAGSRAWVPVIRAAPELPNTLSTTVFAAVATLDLVTQQEDPTAQLNLNDEAVFGSPVNNPVAVLPSPNGRTLYIVLAGSDLVELVDVTEPTQPRLLGFLPAGRNPRGMVLSPDGRYGYVMSYLSRAVTVLDLHLRRVVATITVAPETLDATLLRGKILFNTVTDPRMAKSSWVSCASCHADGGTDNVTWMMADGPRQTPGIWQAGATLPWHWSAALDEPHDVEDSIHTLQFGLGLAPGADPPLLGRTNAGRSADLDALAAFLVGGIRTPRAVAPSAASEAGRALFDALGCVSCHGGPTWTISTLPGLPGTLDLDGNGMVDAVLRDVGTATAADLRGQTGFDVPSLIGVGLTAPYMHDGSLPTLAAVLDSGHPTPGVVRSRPLSPAERDALVAFLLTIDAAISPIE